MAAQPAPIQTAIPLREGYLRAKRMLDVIVTLLILVPFGMLVMGVIAVVVKLDSDGPVFFRQKRYGMNGEPFEMLKFRSMYVNNDDTAHRQAIVKFMDGEKIVDGGGSKVPYKLKDDKRITRVGRLLRRTSLDELPQFFNVLRGEMSLVGPRPPVEYEYKRYSSRDMLRLSGKPGLTGPWQVYGRSRVAYKEMIEMDLAYLERQSLLYDVKLILLTIPAAFRGG